MRPSKSTAPRRAAPSKRAAFSEDAFESRKLLSQRSLNCFPKGRRFVVEIADALSGKVSGRVSGFLPKNARVDEA